MTEGPRLSELLGATDRETVLAEDFAEVVQKISNLLGYAEDGNWRSVHEKIGSLHRALDTFDRKISEPAVDVDGDKVSVYRDPIVDAERTVQLITAYAQTHGGRLGPVLFPIDRITNGQAIAQIRAKKDATERFRKELLGDNEDGQ